MTGTSTARPTRPAPAVWARADTVIAALLWVVAAAVYLGAVWAVARSQVLMGEEMSVSVRDVLFAVEQRTQATVWSTNTVAPVYYWLASHLDPSYSLFSARRWKAVLMALLAPLAYVALRRRLGCTRATATLGAATAVLMPCVAMFGWLATDNGFDTVLGVAALLLATSPARWWPAAPAPALLAVAAYPSGVAWTAAVLAVCGLRVLRGPGRLAAGARVAAAVVAGAAAVLYPLLWWTAGPKRILVGGGTFEGTLLANAANLVRQLTVNGSSYYFFSDAPGLGSAVLAGAALLAAVVAARARWTAAWPWLLVAAVTVVLWLPAGNLPGIRRTIALGVVAALVVAVAVDVLAEALPVAPVVTAATAALLVLGPLALTEARWQLDHVTGSRTLAADFPIPPGPMPPTFDAWTAQLRAGTLTTQDMVADHDGLRTLAVVWMLADRRSGDTAGLPTPRQIVDLTVRHPM